jgi:uncharacterized repeat protein (TIGR02543 family)
MQKKGYVFAGWYRDPEFTERYDMSFTQEECEDFVLYAKWVKESEAATLKLVGAESKFMYFGTNVGGTFAPVTPVEKAGYVFAGWYTDAEFTSEFDFETTIDKAGTFTLYAKWVKEGAEETETTTIETETTASDTESVVTTESNTETQKQEEQKPMDPATTIVIIVAAVVIVCAVALVILRAVKKKKQ